MVKKNVTSLADKAYFELEEKIVTLELKPGTIVSENDISQLLNIGRMPIRLAIKRLEAASLVSSIPRKGILINDIKIEDAFLQLEVRFTLERMLVHRACKHATQEEQTQLLVLANRYEKATKDKDRLESIKVDDEFNQLLGKCSRNVFAWKAILPFYSLCRRLYYYNYQENEDLTLEINQAHIDQMKEIAAGEETLAQEKLNHLYRLNEKLIMTSMASWLPTEDLFTG